MKAKNKIRLRTAISDSVLQLATKTTERGRVYLFIKDRSGAYHAFTEVGTKDALRDFGVDQNQILKLNTRVLAKKFLGI